MQTAAHRLKSPLVTIQTLASLVRDEIVHGKDARDSYERIVNCCQDGIEHVTELLTLARVQDAPALLDIEQSHIDSSIYIGEAGLEFAERLAGLGARVAVPSTLNVSSLDEHHWQEWPVPAAWAGHSCQ